MIKTKYWFMKINGKSIGKYATIHALEKAFLKNVTTGEDKITIVGRFCNDERKKSDNALKLDRMRNEDVFAQRLRRE